MQGDAEIVQVENSQVATYLYIDRVKDVNVFGYYNSNEH